MGWVWLNTQVTLAPGGSEEQGHSKLMACLGHLRPCLRKGEGRDVGGKREEKRECVVKIKGIVKQMELGQLRLISMSLLG